jgi:phosphomannomutase
MEKDRFTGDRGALEAILANVSRSRGEGRETDDMGPVVIVSGSKTDRDNWKTLLEGSRDHLFGRSGSTRFYSFQERLGTKRRQGNMLGTLLACRRLREKSLAEGFTYRDRVTLMGMVFGRGERMSPVTQALGDRKSALCVSPARCAVPGMERGLTAIEEGLLYFIPVVSYLEKRGFRGVLDKWGDETEIAAVDLTAEPDDPEAMADHDIVKMISVMEITGELARQKDWVVSDDKGNMLGQLSRNSREVLVRQLREAGIEPDPTGAFRAGVSLGPVAVSYDVADIAEEVFAGELEKEGVYFDFDPYFLMALTFGGNERDWERELAGDPGLAALAGPGGMVPDFFTKIRRIKELFRQRHGRPLNIKTMDLGKEVYWADIGQHSAMRGKYLNLLLGGGEGEVARKIAGLDKFSFDRKGNIIVDSVIGPEVDISGSVVVNSTINGKGRVRGSVVLDSSFADLDARRAFAVRSRRLGNTRLERHSGLYESYGAGDLRLGEGMRHVSVLTGEGKKDMMVSEGTDLRDKERTYNVPVLGNGISFEQAYNEMFGTGMDLIERRRAVIMNRMDRIEEKMKRHTPLRFGTSGLRDTADKLTDMEVCINVRGFIRFLRERGEAVPGGPVAVAGDLRSSTPRIIAAVAAAISAEGMRPDPVGDVPSPTLAFYAMKKGIPSIMVTGSHIPDVTPDNPCGRNGIKFTKKSGEVLKEDEAAILASVKKARMEEYGKEQGESVFDEDGSFREDQPVPVPVSREEAVGMYISRYTDAFGGDALKGVKVAVYQHSAVGREIVPRIFEELGAEVERVGASDEFIPVDTEKISEETTRVLEEAARKYGPRAVVSFDGDTDRPILADENGKFLPGDKLGALVSIFLNPDFAAIPVSANPAVIDALEGAGIEVEQTRIGSPYVIKAMNDKVEKDPESRVTGWESNGGYLLGSDWTLESGHLDRLPTRDAVLPLLAPILLSVKSGKELSELIDEKLPPFATAANVVDVSYPGMEDYTPAVGKAIIDMFTPSDPSVVSVTFKAGSVENVEGGQADEKELLDIRSRLGRYFTPERGFGLITGLNFLDGIRITFDRDGQKEIYHMRPSGNAPEFRSYTAAAEEERAARLVELRSEIIPGIAADISPEASPDTAPADEASKRIASGTPYIITPYRNEKVWGTRRSDGMRIGEDWYGLESSISVNGASVPVEEVIPRLSRSVLGERVVDRFGEKAMPLVKILTPRGRLSAQFHDSKNELWIITGIDREAAGEKPSLILGFSREAVDLHGKEVARVYGNVLERYGRELNALIDVMEAEGCRDLMLEEENAEKAAELVGEDNGAVHKALTLYREAEAELDSFYNHRPVSEGDVIPIPSGTLHALGAGIEIIEPQIPGPTQSLEDGATYPVRYYFPGYEREGAGKMLDLDRVDEMTPEVVSEQAPVEAESGKGYTVERLPGGFEDKGLEVHRINMRPGACVRFDRIKSFHTLVAVSEGAEVVVKGETFPIPAARPDGEMLQVPASAGSMEIRASADVRVIDTFTPVDG